MENSNYQLTRGHHPRRSEKQQTRKRERSRKNFENNREAISNRRRESRLANANRRRATAENQYLGESLSDECPELLIGGMNVNCKNCDALLFTNEHGRIKHNCCHHGKIQLASHPLYPEALKKLLFGNSSDAKHFRQNIRSYNAAFAMAAFSPAEEICFRGVSCVTVRGEVNALATTSLLTNASKKPRYAQIYIHENDAAYAHRLSDKCILSVLQVINSTMNFNPYVKMYKTLYQRYEEHPEEDIHLVFQRYAFSDGRRYNLPTASATAEVAAIIVSGSDGYIPSAVDFTVFPKQNQECQKMYKLSHHVEPMVFPLLFPYGNTGFSTEMKSNVSGRRITAVQYYGWQLRVTNNFNIITMAGRLTQQYIIHGYITNEWNRLNYYRTHQEQFRRESVQGLLDHVEQSAANTSDTVRLGRVMVLPSTFEGSPRSMQQHFQDAMALSREIGRPDLFITFTANPQWPELRDFLRTLPTGYSASDIPHVVIRAFFVRLDTFIKEISSGAVFGKILGYTYNIEFQKRGLPHAHCLFILNPRDKLLTPEAIDRFICAEIPVKETFPNWYGKVMKHMLHGPHSAATPCYNIATGVCQKKFPYAFNNATDMSRDGFPLYKRRDNRREMNFYNKRMNNRLISVDNSIVVPYNPYLLIKYDCHINVEYCGSVMAYKYIFKYVNKGHDRIHVKIASKDKHSITNEIQDYVDTRYVSSMEAAWRLLELPLHENSHVVIRLPVHLPGQQYVTFQEGRESEALQSQNSVTQLIAFFQLNSVDTDARQYKYDVIPKHYVWIQNERKWKKRLRGGEKLIVRLYSVSPKDSERFFLKFLLQHVSGPCSFKDLRTVNGQEFCTFREAAYCLGFGESDNQVEEILDEVCSFMMPKQLRIFFSYLLLTCIHVNAKLLWSKFSSQMCDNLDEQVCLQDIEQRLKSEDKTLSDFGLPTLQTEIPTHFDDVSANAHCKIAENMILQLNCDQIKIFNAIVSSLDSPNYSNKIFFIDGPGGTGKTFLYKCLYHHQRQYAKNVLCVAWTGIATVLLPNGRTAHRIFKLPIKMPAAEEPLTPLYLDKNTKKYLVKTDLIIWDEASMIPGVALKLIDLTLQDLLKCNFPFGGKSILFGGDFRQVLPVIKRAGKDQIISGTIKSLTIWSNINRFYLRQNMRASSHTFGNWLLSIGNGDVEHVDVSEFLCDDLITETFGTTINTESLSDCVLLAPLNDQVNNLNMHVLDKLPGDTINCFAYNKATSIDGDGTNDESVMIRFQPEYLAKINATGLPLHKLSLKVGAIVMLIRNLCITDGLCNGTRLLVQKITKSALFCTILTGDRAGNTTCIPRITLNTKNGHEFPFVLHRTQFPVRLAFALTINKSQGQTFNKVGLFIDQNCSIFTHGQLYVALSRCRTKSGLKVKIIGSRNDAEKVEITNVVFKEVL